jgi:hypothetical protein
MYELSMLSQQNKLLLEQRVIPLKRLTRKSFLPLLFDLPDYKAPDCGPTPGGLSPATRAAVGQQIQPLSALAYRRAWLLWSDSPLTPACSAAQLTSLGLDPHHPLLVTENSEYVFDGLWLLEKQP